MIRRNPGDQDLRDLERRARAGDPEAQARLDHARRRVGVLEFPPGHAIFDPERTDRNRSGLNPGWLLDYANNPLKTTAVTYLQREWFDVVRVEVVQGPQTIVQPDWGYGRWGSTENQWAWPPEWEQQTREVVRATAVVVHRLVIVGYLWNGTKWAWPVIGRIDADASDVGSAEQRALSYLNHNKLMGVPLDWLGYPTICASMAPGTVSSWKKEDERVYRLLGSAEAHDRVRAIDADTVSQRMQYLASRKTARAVAGESRILRTPFYPSIYMRWARTIVPDAFRNMLPEDAYGAKIAAKAGTGWDVRSRVVAMQEPPAGTLGERMLRFMVDVDSMGPYERLRWAQQFAGHGSSTRPARMLFPDRPRGFVQAARALRDFAEWSAWSEDRSILAPWRAERVDPDQAASNRFNYALLLVEEALQLGATPAQAAEALSAIRLDDVGRGVLRGEPVRTFMSLDLRRRPRTR